MWAVHGRIKVRPSRWARGGTLDARRRSPHGAARGTMNRAIQTVLLIRHARSTANDDPTVYSKIPDHAIPLSRPTDDPAAVIAGAAIRGLGLAPKDLCSWCSTYLRCGQTEGQVLTEAYGAAAPTVRRRASFLLREQEFGDWDSLTEAEIAARDPARFARRKLLTDNLGRFY